MTGKDRAPPAARKWLLGIGRAARHLGIYVALLVLAGAGLAVAGKVARMFGFSGNQAQIARVFMLGLYVVAAFAMVGSSRH